MKIPFRILVSPAVTLSFLFSSCSIGSISGELAKAEAVEDMNVDVSLSGNDSSVILKTVIRDQTVIDTSASPFISKSGCEIRIEEKKIENGALISVTATNDSQSAAKLPSFDFPVSFSENAEYLDPKWGGVGFYQGGSRGTHPNEAYPGTLYSPIRAVAENGTVLGISLIYDLFTTQRVFMIRTEWKQGKWHFIFRLVDRHPTGKEEELIRQPYPDGTLAPGEKLSLTFAVCAAPRDKWVSAFKSYRDFFVEKYGACRLKNPDKRPVAALPFGNRSYFAPDNPRGYCYRLDKLGWKPFVDNFLNEYKSRGWERFLVWQVAGSYFKHQDTNMVFEIATAQTEKSVESAQELKRLTDVGVQIGFWMGRATELSAGFDSGKRWAINVDKSEDRKAWKTEINLARKKFGVRFIGLDGVPRGYGRVDHSPDGWYVAEKFLPWIAKEYPDMTFVMEPGIVDFQHLHVPIFVWDMNIPGAPEWQNYLIPGQVTYGVLRPSRLSAGKDADVKDQEKRFRQLKEWGYVPMVFMDPTGKPFWSAE